MPSTFHPELIPEGGLWTAKHRHKLAFVVSVITCGLLRQSHGRTGAEAGCDVPLQMTLLQRLLGKGRKDFATEAVAALVRAGVITRTKNHSGGRSFRHYTLGRFFASAPVVWRTYPAKRLAHKLREATAKRLVEHTQRDPTRAALLANLSAVSLSATGSAKAEALFRADETEADRLKRAAWELSVRDLRDAPASFTHSERTGRVYHAVTNCPRELRRHLLLDGEPTAEVDLAGAQFFLLLGLYPDADYPERLAFSKIVGGDIYSTLFADLCAAGQGAKWGGTVESWHAAGGESLRDAFKVHAFSKLLYERIYPDSARGALWQTFSARFPALSFTLSGRRRTGAATREFNCAMQRAESALMLGRVVPRLLREIPACKPVTIHDGILCQARFAEAVRAVYTDEALSAYGVRPLVRCK